MKVILFSKRAARPEFHYPAAGPRRTLIVDWRFTAKSPSLVMTPRQPHFVRRVATFKPEAIAASLPQILELHRTFGAHCRPTHALIVFTPTTGPFLDSAARDYLWSLFEVPIFEQVIDSTGRLIAFECEAHRGLHLAARWSHAAFGPPVAGRCDCGQLAERLLIPEKARAAYAS